MKCRIFYLLLLCPLFSRAQDVKTAVIKIDTTVHAETFIIPYSDIHVLDARFDRSKIGCSYNTVFLNSISFEKSDTKFPHAFDTYFPGFLKTFIKTESSSKDQLLVLVKQFRIADHFLRGIESDPIEIELTLRISASFYALHDNRYYKLFSVDNILLHHIEKPHERKRRYEEGSRSVALQIILYKLLRSQNWQLNTSHPSFTMQEVQDALQKRFELPVYTSPLKKGLYGSFSNFKNNTPSTEDFIVIYKDNKVDHIEHANGQMYLPEEVWGICDGTKKYLYIRGEFSELLPTDRSFRVLSYAKRSELAGSTGNYDLFSSTFGKLKDNFKAQQYFDLDMETGNLYLQEVFGKSSVSF
jgi:hypothetical protein